MKKYFLFSFAVTLVALQSCNNNAQPTVEEMIESADVQQMKKYKGQFQAQADSLIGLANRLTRAIDSIAPPVASTVSVSKLQDTLYQHYIKLQADIASEQDVQITPEYGGIMTLKVREGQYVGKGALLAVIGDGGLSDQYNQAKIQVDQARAQLQQAEIQRDLAKTTYDRQRNLWNQKIGSEMQFLQAKTNYETSEKQVIAARQQIAAAQKGVSGLQAQLAKTNLYAPYSGVVEEIITESGQVVSPGVPVLRLVNTSQIKATANVPETYLPYIENGTKAEVFLPALGKTIDGQVNLISAAVNPTNRTFKVEVPVNNADGSLKPNLNAELRLNDYTNPNAIVINENVIKKDGKGDYVFVAIKQNGKTIAKKVYVTKGKSNNARVEIASGLQEGQMLIIEAPAKLQDGDQVTYSAE